MFAVFLREECSRIEPRLYLRGFELVCIQFCKLFIPSVTCREVATMNVYNLEPLGNFGDHPTSKLNFHGQIRHPKYARF